MRKQFKKNKIDPIQGSRVPPGRGLQEEEVEGSEDNNIRKLNND